MDFKPEEFPIRDVLPNISEDIHMLFRCSLPDLETFEGQLEDVREKTGSYKEHWSEYHVGLMLNSFADVPTGLFPGFTAEIKQQALEQAYQIFTEQANQGFSPAVQLAARCCVLGQGPAKDHIKAEEWMDKLKTCKDPHWRSGSGINSDINDAIAEERWRLKAKPPSPVPAPGG